METWIKVFFGSIVIAGFYETVVYLRRLEERLRNVEFEVNKIREALEKIEENTSRLREHD